MALVQLDFESQYLNSNTTVGIILPDRPREVDASSFYCSDRYVGTTKISIDNFNARNSCPMFIRCYGGKYIDFPRICQRMQKRQRANIIIIRRHIGIEYQINGSFFFPARAKRKRRQNQKKQISFHFILSC